MGSPFVIYISYCSHANQQGEKEGISINVRIQYQQNFFFFLHELDRKIMLHFLHFLQDTKKPVQCAVLSQVVMIKGEKLKEQANRSAKQFTIISACLTMMHKNVTHYTTQALFIQEF